MAEARIAFDCSESLVRLACHEHGVKINPPGPRPGQSTLRVLGAVMRARKEGRTMSDVARDLNVSPQFVSKVVKQAIHEGVLPKPTKASS